MNKIVLKQTCIVINDYDMGDAPILENTFSVYDPVYHKSYLKGIIYDKDNRVLKLPRGMNLSLLEYAFSNNPTVYSRHDEYGFINPILMKVRPRDDVQRKTLRFIIGDSEYRFTKNKSQLAINLTTGKGKTYITIASLSYWGIRNIIITTSKEWLHQWEDRIMDYSDTTPNEIYFISGSANMNSLFTRDTSKIKFFLVTHATVKSFGDNYGWNKVEELFKALKIGVKVYDEAHLNFDNICWIDFNTNTFKTLYLTATPARSAETENTIYKLSFATIPAIDLFDPDIDPHTRYIALRYNSRPTIQDQSNCINGYGFDKNRYVKYVCEKKEFAYLLHILMNIIIKNQYKTLIYIATNEAISRVYDWIINNYPSYRNHVGIYTSVVNKDDKKDQLNKDIILSTTKSTGAAVDIYGLDLTIVLAEPFKSEILARQTLGRTRNNNTLYIEVVDEGFSTIRNYYNKKLPIFQKYATKCGELRFNSTELENKAIEIVNERKTHVPLFIDKSVPNALNEVDPWKI